MNRPRHLLAKLAAGGALTASLGMAGYGIASATGTVAASPLVSRPASTHAAKIPSVYVQALSASTKARKTPAMTGKCKHMGSATTPSAAG